jgi:hypothetical protein
MQIDIHLERESVCVCVCVCGERVEREERGGGEEIEREGTFRSSHIHPI